MLYIPGTGWKILDSKQIPAGKYRIDVSYQRRNCGGGQIRVIDQEMYEEYARHDDRHYLLMLQEKVAPTCKGEGGTVVVLPSTVLYLIDGTGEGEVNWSVTQLEKGILYGSRQLESTRYTPAECVIGTVKQNCTLYLNVINDDQTAQEFYVLVGDKQYKYKASIYETTKVEIPIETNTPVQIKFVSAKTPVPDKWWIEWVVTVPSVSPQPQPKPQPKTAHSITNLSIRELGTRLIAYFHANYSGTGYVKVGNGNTVIQNTPIDVHAGLNEVDVSFCYRYWKQGYSVCVVSDIGEGECRTESNPYPHPKPHPIPGIITLTNPVPFEEHGMTVIRFGIQGNGPVTTVQVDWTKPPTPPTIYPAKWTIERYGKVYKVTVWDWVNSKLTPVKEFTGTKLYITTRIQVSEIHLTFMTGKDIVQKTYKITYPHPKPHPQPTQPEITNLNIKELGNRLEAGFTANYMGRAFVQAYEGSKLVDVFPIHVHTGDNAVDITPFKKYWDSGYTICVKSYTNRGECKKKVESSAPKLVKGAFHFVGAVIASLAIGALVRKVYKKWTGSRR